MCMASITVVIRHPGLHCGLEFVFLNKHKQMNNRILKYLALSLGVLVGLSSCEDFLDRPTEDNYNVDNFYQTDEQCFQAVNPLYNSPWYDFQRGFFKVGEVMANYYWGGSPI